MLTIVFNEVLTEVLTVVLTVALVVVTAAEAILVPVPV